MTGPGDPARKRYDLTLADHDCPPWEGAPARTILLCSEARSGSTLLGEALYFAGGFGCPLEYFHAGFRPDFEARWHARDADAYLHAAHRHRTAPNGCFATKLFWRDIEALLAERDAALAGDVCAATPEGAPPSLYHAIATTLGALFDTATIVHLQRIDRVRGAVSAELARQTGLWRAIPGVDADAPLADPLFDFDRIATLISLNARAHAHWRNLFDAIGAAPTALSYEALTQDYRSSVARVLAALGRPDAIIAEPRMQRQSSRRSEDFALRYLREAQARLRG